MSEVDYWQDKLRKKFARVLTQAPPDTPKPADVDRGWRKLVEEHRQALLACDHEGAHKHNEDGDTWCARCGARLP